MPRNTRYRKSRRKSRRRAPRATAKDKQQDRRLAKLEKAVEDKFAVDKQSKNISNSLKDATTLHLVNGINDVIPPISQGDGDNANRDGDSISLKSLRVNYSITPDLATPLVDQANRPCEYQMVRVMLVCDNDPTYVNAGQETSPGSGVYTPQFDENKLTWEHIFFNPKDEDTTDHTIMCFRNRDVMRSRRLSVLYDRTHKIHPRNCTGCGVFNISKTWKRGQQMGFSAGGGRAINKRYYLCCFSNTPKTNPVLLDYRSQVVYEG